MENQIKTLLQQLNVSEKLIKMDKLEITQLLNKANTLKSSDKEIAPEITDLECKMKDIKMAEKNKAAECQQLKRKLLENCQEMERLNRDISGMACEIFEFKVNYFFRKIYLES